MILFFLLFSVFSQDVSQMGLMSSIFRNNMVLQRSPEVLNNIYCSFACFLPCLFFKSANIFGITHDGTNVKPLVAVDISLDDGTYTSKFGSQSDANGIWKVSLGSKPAGGK